MSLQIIALGGGGFSTESEPELDQYILDQSGEEHPRVGFIGTASGDAERYLLKFYSRFTQLHCKPSHLALFRRTKPINAWIEAQDVIFVGGGNTKSMIATWHGWDLPQYLRSAYEKGTVMAGVSAGAMCWFDSGVTDSFDSALKPIDCLGFLKGSCCPHYRLEVERKPTYQKLIQSGQIAPGYAIDDGVGLHFIDGKVARIVTASHNACAYYLTSSEKGIVSSSIEGAVVVDITV